VPSQIRLRREGDHYRDRLRAYRIYLDDRPAGRIHPEETVCLDVPPGSHDIELRISWCRSPRLTIDVADDDVAALRCRPDTTLPALAAITIGRHRYVALESDT
jgi:hypothetical protein